MIVVSQARNALRGAPEKRRRAIDAPGNVLGDALPPCASRAARATSAMAVKTDWVDANNIAGALVDRL
jgi:hypothetical protein